MKKGSTRALGSYSEREKECIQGTNGSSIVSKYSAESIYSRQNGAPSFFEPFVDAGRVRRRSPTINRGYWLRMQCVEQVVRCFLAEATQGQIGRKRAVVNLGCGYDPLPFQFLSQGFSQDTLYIDIDYPSLISIKASKVASDPTIAPLLHDLQILHGPTDCPQIRLRSDKYLAVGCDLEHLDWLNKLFEDEGLMQAELLFTAEVSVTYMRTEAANALIKWAAGLPNARFSLLEQIIPDGPDHPFARTMLSHFDSLRTPLQSVKSYPTLQSQTNRFLAGGWAHVHSSDLLAFWCNSISPEQKQHIWRCESFDEWEEFYLFLQHYCLLLASNYPGDASRHAPYFKPVVPTFESLGGETYSYTGEFSGATSSPSIHSVQLQTKSLPVSSPENFRSRFGSAGNLLPDWILYHGGLGLSGRTGDLATISPSSVPIQKSSAFENAPKPRMCHTLTRLDDTTLLLFGGRTSPTNILGDTWLYDGTSWKLWEYKGEQWKLFAFGQALFPEPRFRHCAVGDTEAREVLVFGGVGEGEKVLCDWYVFSLEKQRWKKMGVVGKNEEQAPNARFGAAMCTVGKRTAVLSGGMGEDGGAVGDLWKVEWDFEKGIVVVEKIRLAEEGRRLLGRFGAQMVVVGEQDEKKELLIIGGVSGGGLMRQNEIVVVIDIDNFRVTGTYTLSTSTSFPPPMLVGFAVGTIRGIPVVIGGGAVCFSFGAEWNQSIFAFFRDSISLQKLSSIPSPPCPPKPSKVPRPQQIQSIPSVLNQKPKPLPRVQINTAEDFERIQSQRTPCLITNLDFGSCVEEWTWEYLVEKVGKDKEVVVHVVQRENRDGEGRGRNVGGDVSLSFAAANNKTPNGNTKSGKNFDYVKMPFGDFITAVSASESPVSPPPEGNPIPGMYLRSTSTTHPLTRPTHLHLDFPELSPTFHPPLALLPPLSTPHSSPLRISTSHTALWLHYDVLSNILFHVRGTKLFRLWDPTRPNAAVALGFPPGGSSTTSILNPFDDAELGTHAPAYEDTLTPGTALYIPPLWPHAALPRSPCVAVNVFWRDLEDHRYAPGRDVYGNRDLAAYERGRQVLGGLVKGFKGLPAGVRRFYLERLGGEVLARAKEGDEEE